MSVKFVDTLRVLGRKNAEHQNHILPNFINRSVKTGTTAMNSKFSLGLFSRIPMHILGRYQQLKQSDDVTFRNSDGARRRIKYSRTSMARTPLGP